ncbi:uncharacterized protein [Elaeis guineensis]|uniref:uncharacterized protein n=1 Tax=Elaeis guineensis var. tenera TaxID=51953 RepID=UPI003C6D9AE3
MPWISVSPCPPPSAAAARIASRRTADLFPTRCHPQPPITPSAANSSSESSSSDTKLSTFCAAVAEFSKRPHGPLPPPGAVPRRSLPASYNALMKSFSRCGDADEVRRLFRELQLFRSAPNALCYNTLINSLVVANRHAEAEVAFEEMVSSGVAPTTSSYTILIKSRSLHPSLIDSTYDIIQFMVRSGRHPDRVTYLTLIAGLCRAGRIEEAWGVLDQMLEERLMPTVEAYTCIVHGYCSAGRIEEAKRLMGTMEALGCRPDVVTYSILVEALCRTAEFEEVEKILRESASKGWKPNAITYNIYMNGLCKAGKVDEAFQLFEVMRKRGLCPDAITLNILFDCLCRDSKVWEAKSLLERNAELEWDVDVFFYNTLMSRLCELGEWISVLKLLTDLVKKGIGPDACTFTIVIRSLCRAGKLRKAKCIMSSRGFGADVVAYNTLLHRFYMAGEFNEVQRLYVNMVLEDIVPNKFTYGIMIDSFCREGRFLEAIDCLLGSLKQGFLSDLVVRLNNWLIKGGKLKEILQLLEEMTERGFVPDVRMFNALISAFCREGYCWREDVYKVCLILDKMLGVK